MNEQAQAAAQDDARAMRFWPLFPNPAAEPLDYWRQLAPVYLAALNEACADDALVVQAEVEAWPQTEAEHQAALTALLTTGRLRQAWRALKAGYTASGGNERWEMVEIIHMLHSRPLAEIPSYAGYCRTTCHQLVCLPLAEWRALDNPALAYRPSAADKAVVAALATRVAHAFNVPPQETGQVRDCPGFNRPIVWSAGLGLLTEPLNCHGIAVKEDGRFDGYCGVLRLVLNTGEEWRMAVLAPGHFIRILMRVDEERRASA